jgi:hypothetical protein
MAATAKERFALINENLQEILNPELIESILEKGDSPRIYWGKHSTHVLYAAGHVTKGFFFSSVSRAVSFSDSAAQYSQASHNVYFA